MCDFQDFMSKIKLFNGMIIYNLYNNIPIPDLNVRNCFVIVSNEYIRIIMNIIT